MDDRKVNNLSKKSHHLKSVYKFKGNDTDLVSPLDSCEMMTKNNRSKPSSEIKREK